MLGLLLGTLAATNLIFEPEASHGDDARRIVSEVLWNTYHAFNLDDEDALYDRLSESVTGDLVADLYLDSRRRLPRLGPLYGAASAPGERGERRVSRVSHHPAGAKAK